MSKLKLDHSKTYLTESLGGNEKKMEEMAEAFIETLVREAEKGAKPSDQSEVIEKFFNERAHEFGLDVSKPEHTMIIGIIITKSHQQLVEQAGGEVIVPEPQTPITSSPKSKTRLVN